MSISAVRQKARDVFRRRDREGAKVDKNQAIPTLGRPGSTVKITRGEEIDGDARTTVSRLDGRHAKIDGAPYVATGGPNKGKVIQPVKTDEGAILGVPSDRLQAASGSCGASTARVGGGSRRYAEGYERIFGHK